MFERISERARRVVFFSRMKAGRRGAAAIGVDHLIEALVLEDQGDFSKLFPGCEMGLTPPHPSFFSEGVASEILLWLEPLLTNAAPLPDSADMPMTPELGNTMTVAGALCEDLGQMQVEPLHLLAAVLSEQTNEAEPVRQAGVTRDAVTAAIKTGNYS